MQKDTPQRTMVRNRNASTLGLNELNTRKLYDTTVDTNCEF